MFTAASALLSRFVPIQAISRRDKVVVCLAASLHLATLGLMAATEVDLVSRMIFLLVWALLNFFWLTLSRRPFVAAIISLVFVVTLTLLSQFKHDKLWMTADFVDVMIIDQDTLAFLLAALPSLRLQITTAGLATAVFWASRVREELLILPRARARHASQPSQIRRSAAIQRTIQSCATR